MNTTLTKQSALTKQAALVNKRIVRNQQVVNNYDEVSRAFTYFTRRYEQWIAGADREFTLVMGEACPPPAQKPGDKFYITLPEDADRLIDKIEEYLSDLDYVPADYDVKRDILDEFGREFWVAVKISI